MSVKKWFAKVSKVMPPKLIGLIISILFFSGFVAIYSIKIGDGESDFYQDVAVYILVSWLAILIIYYSWAIGFYNINYGWMDEDWERWNERRKYDPEAVKEAPTKNPHSNETLGLPNGTIRGTIAISLLVLGVAMMIASLTFSNTYQPPELFVDNFKFFKDAFLLMIAFYFGNKGLELIKSKQEGSSTAQNPAPPAQETPAPVPSQPVDESGAAAGNDAPETSVPVAETSAPVGAAASDFKDPNSVG